MIEVWLFSSFWNILTTQNRMFDFHSIHGIRTLRYRVSKLFKESLHSTRFQFRNPTQKQHTRLCKNTLLLCLIKWYVNLLSDRSFVRQYILQMRSQLKKRGSWLMKTNVNNFDFNDQIKWSSLCKYPYIYFCFPKNSFQRVLTLKYINVVLFQQLRQKKTPSDNNGHKIEV